MDGPYPFYGQPNPDLIQRLAVKGIRGSQPDPSSGGSFRSPERACSHGTLLHFFHHPNPPSWTLCGPLNISKICMRPDMKISNTLAPLVLISIFRKSTLGLVRYSAMGKWTDLLRGSSLWVYHPKKDDTPFPLIWIAVYYWEWSAACSLCRGL